MVEEQPRHVYDYGSLRKGDKFYCCLEVLVGQVQPGCDRYSCHGCEYLGLCLGDPQKLDYCPRPRTCPSCGEDCTKCELWLAPNLC